MSSSIANLFYTSFYNYFRVPIWIYPIERVRPVHNGTLCHDVWLDTKDSALVNDKDGCDCDYADHTDQRLYLIVSGLQA